MFVFVSGILTVKTALLTGKKHYSSFKEISFPAETENIFGLICAELSNQHFSSVLPFLFC